MVPYGSTVGSNGQVDGRHARRQRNRQAIIDAVFELVGEGKIPPSADDVAARAGVSVSSIFRNFDGLHDLQHAAIEHHQATYAHLLDVSDTGDERSDRVRSHVRSRVGLFENANGLYRIARARALDHEPVVEGLARLRGRLADQTRRRFAAELRQLTPAEAVNLVALIDATTSPEAFDVMRSAHARSSRQISTTWIAALDALFGSWVPDTEALT